MLVTSCIYPYIFETPPPDTARKMRRYDRIPNPFAMHIPRAASRVLDEGEALALEVTVFGNAIRQLPYVIRAFEIAGSRGLTSRRVPLTLDRAETVPVTPIDDPTTISEQGGAFRMPPAVEVAEPTCPVRVLLQISSPLRLKEAGDLVVPENFEARHLLSSLVRRVSMLMYFHTSEPLVADFTALKAAAQRAELFARDLRWIDLTRNSSRQRTLMQMGGLIGTVGIDLRDAVSLWPYLWLGQFVQVGKGTTMGLGHYRIVDSAVPLPAVAEEGP